jgi:hypothetical protein
MHPLAVIDSPPRKNHSGRVSKKFCHYTSKAEEEVGHMRAGKD